MPDPSKVEPEIVEPPKPPAFASFPKAINLPTDELLAVLATTHTDATVELLTNAADLTQIAEKLLWKGDVIAGLRSEGGAIQFRWVKEVSPEVDSAVRNSLLHLTAGDDEHFLALREPIVGEPLTLDLRDSTIRVNGKCEWLPPAEDVRFALTLAGQIPVKVIDGPSVVALKIRDETILAYQFTGDAATKVTMKKSGDVLAALFASQYVLPSGDVEPLSISRGTRTMKQLLKRQADAADAVVALPRLQNYRRDLDNELERAQSLPTGSRLAGGGYIDNPVAMAQKDQALRAVQREIVATERNLDRAQRLVDDQPAIELDVKAMLAVEELAKSIDKAPLPYRFYITVAGHEIDLIKWAPESAALPRGGAGE